MLPRRRHRRSLYVFNVDDDPVKLGLVTNMARPDGNLTGTNFFEAELTAKRLELFRQLVPTASRLAVLVNPTYPVSKSTVRDVAAAAPGMGFQIRVFEASTGRVIDAVFVGILWAKGAMPSSWEAIPSTPAGVRNW